VLLSDDTDWEEIRELVIESYRVLAPKKAHRAARRVNCVQLRGPFVRPTRGPISRAGSCATPTSCCPPPRRTTRAV
jgi:hypothetical protein